MKKTEFDSAIDRAGYSTTTLLPKWDPTIPHVFRDFLMSCGVDTRINMWHSLHSYDGHDFYAYIDGNYVVKLRHWKSGRMNEWYTTLNGDMKWSGASIDMGVREHDHSGDPNLFGEVAPQ